MTFEGKDRSKGAENSPSHSAAFPGGLLSKRRAGFRRQRPHRRYIIYDFRDCGARARQPGLNIYTTSIGVAL